MPQYKTNGSGLMTLNTEFPTVLFPGDEKYVFGLSHAEGQPPTPGQIDAPNDTNCVFETVAVAEASIAVALAPRPTGGAPGVMVQIVASADPGVCEFDVQDAAIDADGAYILPTASTAYIINTWTAVAGGLFTAWTELQPEGGRFVRIKCITNPNTVKFKAKIVYV